MATTDQIKKQEQTIKTASNGTDTTALTNTGKAAVGSEALDSIRAVQSNTGDTTPASDTTPAGGSGVGGVGGSQTGGGSGGSGSGSGSASTSTSATASATSTSTGSGIEAPTLEGIGKIDTTEQENNINAYFDAALQQQQNQIDYDVENSVKELQRTEEDAAEEYDNERKQINIEEAKALQNQALYAEARGDRGGIGAAQYAQIQATAATNRRTVTNAQTKLSTDTARQITDLRAQGEFEKADAVLQVTQEKLSQLMSLWEFATETNTSIDEFNKEIEQWNEEMKLSIAEVTGTYNGQAFSSNLASAGETLLSAGIMPSTDQLNAMGLNAEQAALLIQATKKSSSSSSSSKTTTGSTIPIEDIMSVYSKYSQFASSDYASNYSISDMATIKRAYDAASSGSTTASTSTGGTNKYGK